MKTRTLQALGLALSLFVSTGCVQKMSTVGRFRPYDSVRSQPPAHTVAWDELPRNTGQPGPITLELLQRGRERYEIFCTPCHAYTGDGNGMIVQRGFLAPPTFHQERLRKVTDQHIYDVITQGFGAMYSYGDRVEPQDRWAIIAYIRALQLSRNVSADQLSAEDRSHLKGAQP